MSQLISSICLFVPDHDQAIEFYTQKLGFDLIQDESLGSDKRWVTIRPAGAKETCILLKKATSANEVALIGQQAAGGVLLILRTDNFEEDYQSMKRAGVAFLEAPREEAYGKVVIFTDLFGNKWDLIEPSV